MQTRGVKSSHLQYLGRCEPGVTYTLSTRMPLGMESGAVTITKCRSLALDSIGGVGVQISHAQVHGVHAPCSVAPVKDEPLSGINSGSQIVSYARGSVRGPCAPELPVSARAGACGPQPALGVPLLADFAPKSDGVALCKRRYWSRIVSSHLNCPFRFSWSGVVQRFERFIIPLLYSTVFSRTNPQIVRWA